MKKNFVYLLQQLIDPGEGDVGPDHQVLVHSHLPATRLEERIILVRQLTGQLYQLLRLLLEHLEVLLVLLLLFRFSFRSVPSLNDRSLFLGENLQLRLHSSHQVFGETLNTFSLLLIHFLLQILPNVTNL